MGFSALLALSFTPALCASLLRPEHLKGNVLFNWFNRAFETTRATYVHRVYQSVGHVPRWMAAFAVMLAVGALLFIKLPGSFVPDEDQGYALIDVLPAGATCAHPRGDAAHQRHHRAQPDVDYAFLIVGSSFTGTGENAGRAFVHLKPWDHRPESAAQFIAWANSTLSREIHDARVHVLNLPTCGDSAFSAASILPRRSRRTRASSAERRAGDTAPEKAAADKGTLGVGVRANLLPPAPQLQLTVDRVQAQSMGLSASDARGAAADAGAGGYANDFISAGARAARAAAASPGA